MTQGICDGAGAIVLASEEAATQNNLTPLARVLAYSTVGVDPTIMGIGPVPAIQNVLKLSGKTLNDIDLVEVLMLYFFRISCLLRSICRSMRLSPRKL